MTAGLKPLRVYIEVTKQNFMFFDKVKSNKFIVYSSYGVMSHVVVNEYGVAFSCNPLLSDIDNIPLAFEGRELAESHKDSFYDKIAEVQFTSKVERYF